MCKFAKNKTLLLFPSLLTGRDSKAGLILPGEAGQVGETGHGGGLRDAVTGGQKFSGPLHPQVHEKSLGRHSVSFPEPGGEVAPINVQCVCQRLNAYRAHVIGFQIGAGVFRVAAGPFYQIVGSFGQPPEQVVGQGEGLAVHVIPLQLRDPLEYLPHRHLPQHRLVQKFRGIVRGEAQPAVMPGIVQSCLISGQFPGPDYENVPGIQVVLLPIPIEISLAVKNIVQKIVGPHCRTVFMAGDAGIVAQGDRGQGVPPALYDDMVKHEIASNTVVSILPNTDTILQSFFSGNFAKLTIS